MNVNHSDKSVLIGNTTYKMSRGESCRSIDSWIKLWGGKWTRQKARGFFKLLESDQMLTIETTNQTTIVKVCNYDSYQHPQPSKKPTEQPSNNHQITTNNNVNNDNKKVKKKESKEKSSLSREVEKGSFHPPGTISKNKMILPQDEPEPPPVGKWNPTHTGYVVIEDREDMHPPPNNKRFLQSCFYAYDSVMALLPKTFKPSDRGKAEWFNAIDQLLHVLKYGDNHFTTEQIVLAVHLARDSKGYWKKRIKTVIDLTDEMKGMLNIIHILDELKDDPKLDKNKAVMMKVKPYPQ